MLCHSDIAVSTLQYAVLMGECVQVYEGDGHAYEQQHEDNGGAHHGHEDLVLNFGEEAVHSGGYVEDHRQLKRYRVR